MAQIRSRGRGLSVEEFARLPEEEGYRLELSRGEVVREPAPGRRHGLAASRVARALWRHSVERGAGLVLFDTGFALGPDTVRVPDVAFLAVEPEAAPEGVAAEEGGAVDPWIEGAPDLAVEVVSPANTASALQAKALQYLEAGARLVWIVDPASRTVTVLRSHSEIRILVAGDVLEGGDVLPELRVGVEELFEATRSGDP